MVWDTALEAAFHPQTVALVGISSGQRGGSFGRANFLYTYRQLGFKGRIYPVNPKVDEIMGLKAYPNVRSIPEPIDLVVVTVPAPALPDVLEDCIAASAKNVYVFTAGFEETGKQEAMELGKKVKEIAVRGGLRMIGPNSMGIYVPSAGIGSFDRMPKRSGPVAFLSQSGGHCNWHTHNAQNYGIYFSKVISFGNAYVLDSTDYLEYLAIDLETKIVNLYLEGVKEGRKLLIQVKEINRTKPVILWKGGLTESVARAPSALPV